MRNVTFHIRLIHFYQERIRTVKVVRKIFQICSWVTQRTVGCPVTICWGNPPSQPLGSPSICTTSHQMHSALLSHCQHCFVSFCLYSAQGVVSQCGATTVCHHLTHSLFFFLARSFSARREGFHLRSLPVTADEANIQKPLLIFFLTVASYAKIDTVCIYLWQEK